MCDNNKESRCVECTNTNAHANKRLAEAYIPFQGEMGLGDIYEGFRQGTIFPALQRPYESGDSNWHRNIAGRENHMRMYTVDEEPEQGQEYELQEQSGEMEE